MTTKHINISGNLWLHLEEPSKDLAYLTLATCLAALITVVVLRPSTEIILGTLVLVTLVTLTIFLTKTTTTRAEIDRDKGEIRTTKKYLVITLRRSVPLRDFDSILMLTQDETVEDGYRLRQYTVALSGKSRSLELLSADSKTEAKMIQRELAEFLGMTMQEAAGSRSE
jgi:hypothetical protein